MFGGMWLYCVALFAASWAHPLQTTCRDFGGDATVDPHDLVGNWTTVYSWSEPNVNMTEIITVSELNAEELREYHEIFKDYPEDKLKLRMLIHDLPTSVITFLDIVSVMVPIDDKGNVDAWAVDMTTTKENAALPSWVKYNAKWKKAEEFLLLMICTHNKAFVLASSSTPDEAKLQELVSKFQFQGYDGARVYHT